MCWHFLHFAVDCNFSPVSFVTILVVFAEAVIVALSAAISNNISSMRLAVELDVELDAELATDADAPIDGSGGRCIAVDVSVGIVAAALISASTCVSPSDIVTVPPRIGPVPSSART